MCHSVAKGKLLQMVISGALKDISSSKYSVSPKDLTN